MFSDHHLSLIAGHWTVFKLWSLDINDNIIAIIDVLESTKCVLQTASLSPVFTQAWLLCDKQGYRSM